MTPPGWERNPVEPSAYVWDPFWSHTSCPECTGEEDEDLSRFVGEERRDSSLWRITCPACGDSFTVSY